jgi:hypothetical protein
MSAGLVGFVTAIYGWVSISELMAGHHGMSLCFAGYALANVGLMLAMAAAP